MAGLRETVTRDQDQNSNPEFDIRAFRHCLGQFATGVTVMTTSTEKGKVGLTANSFSSLSLDPPMILWSIGRGSRSFEAFMSESYFAVNILASDQVSVSQRFASSANDKFEGIGWMPGQNGCPLLHGAAGHLECRTAARHNGGDHVILVGEVQRFEQFHQDPLAFSQGRYGILGRHPDQMLPIESDPGLADPEWSRISGLIFQAHRASWSAFDFYQDRENVNFPQGLILFALWRSEQCDARDLAARVLLPVETVHDECADLITKEFLAQSRNGAYFLTGSGQELRETIRRQAEIYEARQLRSFTPEQIATVRDFLQGYAAHMAEPSEGGAGSGRRRQRLS